MDTEKGMANSSKGGSRLRKGAIVCLAVLSLYILGQVASVFQTRYQLESPMIPKSLIWEINKQFVFKAVVAAVMVAIGLALYFFGKHLFVIILVIVTLIAGRYIYI